jgi:hypothetical protein|tara:strand:+ start:963 stop:1157 length:195 start_codon:yes stop_codon:yes gene_type:complete
MNKTDYFNFINTSTYVQNINQGKTGLMQGIYSQKQKIEPLRDVSNNFYADQTKAQSNYMDKRKI